LPYVYLILSLCISLGVNSTLFSVVFAWICLSSACKDFTFRWAELLGLTMAQLIDLVVIIKVQKIYNNHDLSNNNLLHILINCSAKKIYESKFLHSVVPNE